MSVLIDSNLLGRYSNRGDPQHNLAINALNALQRQGYDLVIVPQNLYEFTSFATRHANANGFGMTVIEVGSEIAAFLQQFTLKYPDPQLELTHFRQLHLQLGVVGKKVHDLRLVAACKALGIGTILTFNDADFRSASAAGHIQVMTPAQVLAPPASSP